MAERQKGGYDFSPLVLDKQVMEQTEQELAYDGGEVRTWQRKLRRKLNQLLGMDKLPKKNPPLNVRSLWKRKHPLSPSLRRTEGELGTIEKIVFTAEPGADVPGYVCIPKHATPPYQWMICVQGHSTGMHNSIGVKFGHETKRMKTEADRDFALGCMRRGVAALCLEQRAFGERSVTPPEPNCHRPAMHALMLGRTLIGERVFDVDRGIDYLATRDDVVRKSLGIMGNSGGGTVSMFSAATLPRLKFAMPSCYFCTFRDSIMSVYHCMCNYVPGLYRVAEMADIMGLFAPKPVVLVAGKDDEIFPVAATRKSFRKLRRIYRAAGAADRCHLVVGDEGHRFYAEKAWPKALSELRTLRSG